MSEQVERGLKLVGSSMGVMQEALEALRRHHAARAHLLDMYSDIMAKHLALLDTVKNLEGHAADLAARLVERDALVEELGSQVSSAHEPTWCCSYTIHTPRHSVCILCLRMVCRCAHLKGRHRCRS